MRGNRNCSTYIISYYHDDSFTFLWKIPYLIIKIKIFQTFPIKTTKQLTNLFHKPKMWKTSFVSLLFKKRLTHGGNAWNHLNIRRAKFFSETFIHDFTTMVSNHNSVLRWNLFCCSTFTFRRFSCYNPVHRIHSPNMCILQQPFNIGKVTRMNFTRCTHYDCSTIIQYAAADPNPTHHYHRLTWLLADNNTTLWLGSYDETIIQYWQLNSINDKLSPTIIVATASPENQ